MAAQTTDPRVKRLLEAGSDEVWRALESLTVLDPAAIRDADITSLVHREQARQARGYLGTILSNVDTLKALCASVDRIVDRTALASDATAESEHDTAQYLQEAERLGQLRLSVEAKLSRLRDLHRAFSMDPQSAATLGAGPAAAGFFDTFSAFNDRLQAAQGGLVYGGDSPETRAELTLATEQLSREAGALMSTALDKTLQHCVQELRDESNHDALLAHVGSGLGVTSTSLSPLSTLLRSVRILVKHAPHLARTCATAFVAARRASLLRALLQLTGGQSLSSGGSLTGERFVSDTLAWLRTRLVEEAELLAALFQPEEGLAQRDGGAQYSLPSDTGDDTLDSAPALLCAISDGVARPLGARLEWAVTTQDELVSLFRLMDTLHFYTGSLAKILGPTAALCGAIAAAHAQCRARLDTLSAVVAARLHAAVPAYPTSLMPAPPVVDASVLLADLCRTVSAGGMAVDGDSSAEAARQSSARSCVEALVSAILLSTASAGGALSEEDAATLQLNAQASIQSVLAPYAVAAATVQRLAAEMAGQEEVLVSSASGKLLVETGLLGVLSAVRSGTVEGGSSARGGAAVAACDKFVKAISAPSALRFDAICDPRVRQRVRRDTAGVCSAAFTTVHGHTVLGGSAAAALSGKPSHTPAEVDVLLDLQ